MHSTHEAELDLPQILLHGQCVHVAPELKLQSLLSISQLCDAGCEAMFTRTHVTIQHSGACILTGKWDPEAHLWHVHVPTKPAPTTLTLSITAPPDECNKTIGQLRGLTWWHLHMQHSSHLSWAPPCNGSEIQLFD